MSEQLRKQGYLNDGGVAKGDALGTYESFVIGDTTMNQLKKAGIVPKREYAKGVGGLKPDGLVVDRRDSRAPVVKLIVEDKDKGELDTEKKLNAVLKKCADTYCPALECDLFAVTDGTDTYWAVATGGGDYARIVRDDGFPLDHSAAMHDETTRKALYRMLTSLDETLDRTTGEMETPSTANPTELADKVWQAVWLASGANPDACLATFIEVLLFKFLSDLGVLTTSGGVPVDFATVRGLPNADILKYYADHVRPAVKTLFPPDATDGTSVINGTVLDPANADHGRLFARMLKEFDKAGSLRRINPEFKSRIFERFLKKTISQKNWGQFFTPRNVVKAMVEMSGIEQLTAGAVVCDPACGVGGFVLEPLINKRTTDFRGGASLTYKGMDRDQKTTILAKANMLVHLSDLLDDDPVGAVPGLAKAINDTFSSMDRYISGSLSDAPKDEYDLVLSNPPYVVSGTTQQKQMLASDTKLNDYYDTSSMGVEGLFMQLIVKGLKKGGRALVVIPDGMLFRHGDMALRKFIMKYCDIEAVISLPKDTFYTTSKKTYILVIRKKQDEKRQQTAPVFTYLVSAVGETLDTHRFVIDENHLPDMAQQFRLFSGNPTAYSAQAGDLRCRIQPISKFDAADSWVIDHWWTGDELETLGAVETKTSATPQQLVERLSGLRSDIEAIETALGGLAAATIAVNSVEVKLGDTSVFTMSIGKRITKKALRDDIKPGNTPVYSANVREPFAMVNVDVDVDVDAPEPGLPDGCFVKGSFTTGSVLWGIDGDWETVPTSAGEEFGTTDHCGRIQMVAAGLDPQYIAAAVYRAGAGRFTREYRPSLERMKPLTIRIPIDASGDYDLDAQRTLAARFHEVERARREVEQLVTDALDIIPEPLDITPTGTTP